jgi:cell division protein FtsL
LASSFTRHTLTRGHDLLLEGPPMRIFATATAIGLTIASAYFLYTEAAATRQLEAHVQATERKRDRLEAEIAVLKAERAYLSRPGRIEPAARALGMRPPGAGDYAALSDVTAPRGAFDARSPRSQ